MPRLKKPGNKADAGKDPHEAAMKALKEIDALEEQIQAKNAALESLARAKLEEDRIELRKAVKISGKTVKKVLEMLK